MELDVVNEIHSKVKLMLKTIKPDEEKPKLLIAETYDKNNLMAGFFFDEKGNITIRAMANYHVLITVTKKDNKISIIINDCDPVIKVEPSLES